MRRVNQRKLIAEVLYDQNLIGGFEFQLLLRLRGDVAIRGSRYYFMLKTEQVKAPRFSWGMFKNLYKVRIRNTIVTIRDSYKSGGFNYSFRVRSLDDYDSVRGEILNGIKQMSKVNKHIHDKTYNEL